MIYVSEYHEISRYNVNRFETDLSSIKAWTDSFLVTDNVEF